MGAIETIAAVMVIAGLIKIVILLVNPKAWMNFAKGVWKNTGLMQVVMLILSGVILYYLLDAGMTIVQVLAAGAFLATLMAVGLASHIDNLMQKYDKQVKKGNLFKDNWLYIIIWIALLTWAAKELWM